MPQPSAPQDPNARFSARAVRRVLQLAVEEQHRLETELADSYSIEELEEMAAEAGISSEALRAGLRAQARESRGEAQESRAAEHGRSGSPARRTPAGWQAALERRLPQRWSPAVRSLVLAGGGFAALSGLLMLLAVMAPTAFWVTSLSMVALCVLMLFGASPF